ncbi:hypothetical protein GGR58DRAFT_490707 [Xylaria digitata]|nr:hypothetical protein GGR58DRAFT_490707 [Xylaria digitata]
MEHCKNRHLGLTCHWPETLTTNCGHTTATESELETHFNTVHIARNRIKIGSKHKCSFPLVKFNDKTDEAYLNPCGRPFPTRGSADRHAREHQFRLSESSE